MANNHHYRVVVIIPAARVNAFNTWVQNNLDPGGVWFIPSLQGKNYAWCSGGFTAAQARLIVNQLCTVASITPPDWANMTSAQRRRWAVDNRAAIRQAASCWIDISDNAGSWTPPDDILSGANVTR